MAHQVKVDSLEPGRITREMIRARARSRCGRAEQAEPGSHGVHGGGVPVWQRPGDRHRLAAGTSCWPFSPASIRSMTWSGSADRLATVSFLTLPASR